MLTMYDDDATVFTAMQAGARGYLLKGADQDEIAAPSWPSPRGRPSSDPRSPAGCSRSSATRRRAARETTPFPDLTEREREILDLLASGMRTQAIADTLFLSPKTVSNNLTTIFAKLEVDRPHGGGDPRPRGRSGRGARVSPTVGAVAVSALLGPSLLLPALALLLRGRTVVAAGFMTACGLGVVAAGTAQAEGQEALALAAGAGRRCAPRAADGALLPPVALVAPGRPARPDHVGGGRAPGRGTPRGRRCLRPRRLPRPRGPRRVVAGGLERRRAARAHVARGRRGGQHARRRDAVQKAP